MALVIVSACAAFVGACAADGAKEPGGASGLLSAKPTSVARVPVRPDPPDLGGAAGSAQMVEAETLAVPNTGEGGAAAGARLMEVSPPVAGAGAGGAAPEAEVPSLGGAGVGVAGSGGREASAGGQGGSGGESEAAGAAGASGARLNGGGGSSAIDNTDRGVLPTVWPIVAPRSVLGLPTVVSGSPTPRTDDGVYSIVFDGEEDRMLVESNPLSGATEFTLEVVFRPGGGDFSPAKAKQRLVHIEEQGNPSQRIELGVHLDDEDHWALAVSIQAGGSELTLVDPTLRHPDEAWAHAAITYKDQALTTYVRGKRELSGALNYQPLAEIAKTSIGAGMSATNWFNGEMSYVAVTARAVPPEEFLLVSRAEED